MSVMDLLSSSKKDLSVKQLLIFNPNIKTKEGEDEKKLLYSFSNQTRYSDLANLGLFQTLIGFFSQFSKPITTVTMVKTKTFLYSPEPSFWVSYTVSSDTPSLDQTGIDLLKFLCNSFILLNGTFTQQFESSFDVFIFKLKKFFDPIMCTVSNDILASPGRLTGIQYASMSKNQITQLINLMNDVGTQFKCVKEYALFQNTQLVHTNFDYSMQNNIFNLFNVLRNGSMDFGSKFNGIRTANDERRIVFGIPEERSRSKSSLAATKDILNCSVFIDGQERKWVVFEHKLFFFHFFLDTENDQSVSTFLLFLNSGLTDLFEGLWSSTFSDGLPKVPKELVNKSIMFYYYNMSTSVKNGGLSIFDKPDVIKMLNHLEIIKEGAKEIYIKGDNGKWTAYICADNKLLEIIITLNPNSTIANVYRLGNKNFCREQFQKLVILIKLLTH
ncbi:hypothetical protein ENUP19_0121G0203 [Entamoeba nuttalli]|uniref:CCZ1/INTU/HSP4 first Longin domain-containing protein n=1 Tax=Entamoeba nuttalli TaxID=412467 RepID=A0ABQ0DJE4_9EUKA